MKTYLKPHILTLIINDDVYEKVPDVCAAVKCSFYRCHGKQLQVRVMWDELEAKWIIYSTGHYMRTDRLDIPIICKEQYIEHYWRPEQEKALDKCLTEVLLEVDEKIKRKRNNQ